MLPRPVRAYNHPEYDYQLPGVSSAGCPSESLVAPVGGGGSDPHNGRYVDIHCTAVRRVTYLCFISPYVSLAWLLMCVSALYLCRRRAAHTKLQPTAMTTASYPMS